MSIIDIILLISSFITAFLSLAILFYSPRTKADIFFSLASLAATLWIISMFFYRISSDVYFIEFFGHLLYYAGISISIGYFLFSTNFLRERKVWYLLHLFIYGLLTAIIFFSRDLFIQSINYSSKTIIFGPTYIFYSVILIGYFLISFWRLISTRKELDSDLKKKQIDFAFWGTGISIMIGIVFDIIIPFFGGFGLFWLGPAAVTLMVVSISYAIFEHNLFNIKVVATELFGAVITIISFIQLIYSKNFNELIFNGSIFLGIAIFSILLVRGVLQEVRQREKIEQLAKDLEKANADLVKLDEARSEFISLAGHQLRAPLTVIKGYTSMLKEGSFGEISKKVSEALERVFISANNLTKLVSDLLDLSRIESGRLKYEFKNIYLEDVVEKVLKELEEVSKQKRVAIEFKNENKKTFSVFGDADKLYEVVMNLLDNALKYSAAGPIAVILKPRSKRLALSVADKGMGIPQNEMSKLFIKFGRTEIAKKEQPGGMGLGLYFVKKIVEDHKGRIWAESPGLGNGSTFFVELPVA